MNLNEVLQLLHKNNIRLSVEGEQLKIDAAKGAVTPEIMQLLKAHKDDLLKAAKKQQQGPSKGLTAVSRDKPLPLSFNQQRLFALQQIAPETAGYNMPLALQLSGPLDINALNQAINQLIARHEIFRCRIQRQEDGEFKQVFVATESITLEAKPLDNNSDIKNLLSQQAMQPFELEDAPLFRINCWQQSPEQHILLVCLHHIISDGVSISIIMRDLAALYQSYHAQKLNSLAPLPFDYGDYAVFQQQLLTDGTIEQELDYWQKNLQGAEDYLRLPTDAPRSEARLAKANTFKASLSVEQSQSLLHFAKAQQITPFMLLLAAQNIVLSRHSQQDDICIGVPVAGRHIPGTQELVGFFVNTLVLRAKSHGQQNLSDFLQQIKQQTLNAFDAQNTPLDMVLERLKIPRSNDYSPLAQVGFNYIIEQQTQSDSFTLDDLTITPIELSELDAKYDMIWGIKEQNQQLFIEIEYNSGLFNEQRIEEFFNHFSAVLQQAPNALSKPLDQLTLIDAPALIAELAPNKQAGDILKPLTAKQRDIYFDSITHSQSNNNYLGALVQTKQRFELATLQQSVNHIVASHSALRLRIVESNKSFLEQAYGLYLASDNKQSLVEISVLQAKGLDEQALLNLAQQQVFTSFNLQQQAPIRFMVLQGTSCDSLLIAAHHIAMDGVSLQLVAKQVGESYQALSQGKAANIYPDNFLDFVEQNHQAVDQPQSLAFYQSLETLEPAQAVLHSSNKPAIKNISLLSSEKAFNNIQSFCQSHGISLINFLQTAFGQIIARFSYRDNAFTFQEVLAARQGEFKPSIGCLFEQRPLKFEPNSNFLTAASALKNFREQAKQQGFISNHSQQQLLNIGPCPFVFNYYITQSELAFNQQNARFDIIAPEMSNACNLMIMQEGEQLLFKFSWPENQCNGEQFLTELFDYCIEQTQESQQSLALETSPFSPEQNLASLLQQAFTKHSEKPAVVSADETLSYQTLAAKAQALAASLQQQGITPGASVAVVLPGGGDFISAILAVHLAGACYIPIDSQYPKARIEHILHDSNASLVISHKNLAANIPSKQKTLWLDEHVSSTQHHAHQNTDYNAPFYTIYTSGSTGKPKGASVSHANELNLLQWYCDEFAINARDNILIASATGFDLSQKNFFAALITGATLVFADMQNYDSDAIASLIAKHNITLVNLAPSVFYPLVEHPENFVKLASLRLVLFGGEAIQMPPLMPWLENPLCQAQVVNMYGPTECTDIASFYRIQKPQYFLKKPVPIGKAPSNVKLGVIDAQQQLVSQGLAGELIIGGASLGLGYREQSLNHNVFVSIEGFGKAYRSGDLVWQNSNGDYIFIRRIDNQVKLRGLRIELEEIEQQIKSQLQASQALCLIKDEQIHGFVISDKPTPKNWRELLAQHLSNYMLPVALHEVASWPLTANGKIDKQALLANIDNSREIKAPTTETEKQLLAIFQEVLGQQNISVDDNFFALGGHSLLAARIASQIRQRFEKDLPVAEVFNAPTIEGIAKLLDEDSKQSLHIDTSLRQGLERFPLSFAQQRLWFVEQLQGASSAFNMPLGFMVKGQLNIQALQQAFTALQQRHEILRTRFFEENGHSYQSISEQSTALKHHTQLNNQGDISQAAQSEALAPFNLKVDAPIRLNIWQQGDNNHYLLLLVVHHIVADGWSLNILLQELFALYQQFAFNQQATLAPLAYQYIDYSLWQQQAYAKNQFEQDIHYWQQQLADSELIELPYDYQRPEQLPTKGAQHSFSLNQEQSQKLKAFAKAKDSSLFIVLGSLLTVLLNKYSRQQTVSFGAPVANRPTAELEKNLGLFINNVVYKQSVDASLSFSELIEQFKQTHINALKHQGLPFDLLVEKLQLPRQLNQTPLFNVMLVLQENQQAQQQNFHINQLAFSPLPKNSLAQDAKYDLTFNINTQGPDIHGHIEYRSQLFKPETISNLGHAFVNLLDVLTSHSEQSMQTQALFNHVAPNNKPTALKPLPTFANTALAAFIKQAQQTPEASATECAQGKLNYQQLASLAQNIAAVLKQQGINTPQNIAICLENSHIVPAIILGIWHAGCAYVPIDTASPKERLAFLIDDASCPLLITDQDEFLVAAPSLSVSDLLNKAQNTTAAPLKEPQPNDLAYVLYTSGSTGKPKGVQIEHGALINYLQFAKDTYFSDSHFAVVSSALSFDATITTLLTPLICGQKALFIRHQSQHLQKLADVLLQSPTAGVFKLTPAHLDFLYINNQQHAASQQKHQLVLGGEQLMAKSVSNWQTLLPNATFINEYGPTETVVGCANFALKAADAQKLHKAHVPIGKAITGSKFYILDANLQPLPQGAMGELYIDSPSAARAYLHLPTQTADNFISHPLAQNSRGVLYKSGDLARLLGDGNYEYLGRIDSQLKIRGFRIEPGEIEAALLNITGIEHAHVTVNKQQHLLAFYQGQQKLSDKDLQQQLKANLPSFMVPQAFVHVAKMPLTNNGKVDSKQLLGLDYALVSQAPYQGPENATEVFLQTLWQQVLNIEPIGINDNFFDLGGHSLLAAQMLASIRQEFDVDMPLRTIFEKPSIKALAKALEDKDSFAKNLPAITKADTSHALPLSFNQQRLWLAAKLAPHSGNYNICLPVKITGQLNPKALEQSINALIARHDVLRTAFIETDDCEPAMLVGQSLNMALTPEAANANEFQSLVQQQQSQAFSLEDAPLFRVKWYQEAEQHLLVFTIHHIIADAVSLQILLKELAFCYSQFSQKLYPALPANAFGYADFASWQRTVIQGEYLQQQLTFWQKFLQGAPSGKLLTYDKPLLQKQSYQSAVIEHPLPATLCQQVFSQAKQQRLTPFMLLLACQHLVLSRFSGQQDFCVGVPIAGRHIEGTQNVLGFFINTLILRLQSEDNPSVESFLQQTKQQALKAFAHQDAPFEQVLEHCKKHQGHAPDIQVGFNYITSQQSVEDLQLEGLSIEQMPLADGDAKYDMIWSFHDDGEDINLTLEYNRDGFYSETIDELVISFEHLLSGLISQPEAALNQLQSLPEALLKERLSTNLGECTLLPLNAMQRDLYLEQQLQPGSRGSHLGWLQHFDTLLNKDLLQQAIDSACDNHSALRMRIVNVDAKLADIAYQGIVSPNKAHYPKVQTLKLEQEHLSEQALFNVCKDYVFTPYQLAQEPLFALYLIEREPGKHSVLLTGDHILFDAIAMQSFIKSYLKNYQLLAKGRAPQHFKDSYLKDITQDVCDSQQSYQHWHKKGQELEPLAPMGDKNTPLKMDMLSFASDDKARLAEFCQSQQTHLAHFLKAVYALVLQSHFNPQKDFSIIEVLAGRAQSQRHSIGCYFKNQPLAFSVDSLKSDTSHLLQAIQSARLNNRENGFISSGLQQQLLPHGLPVYFNFYTTARTLAFEESDINLQFIAPEMQGSINLTVFSDGNDLQLKLQYPKGLINGQQFLAQLQSLSLQCLEERKQLPSLILSDSVNSGANQTAAPTHTVSHNALELFEQQVLNNPSAIAISQGLQTLSYQQLNQQANQLAHLLQQQFTVEKGDRIAIALDKNHQAITAILAAVKLGACYIPIDSQYPAERIRYMLNDANARCLISQNCVLEKLEHSDNYFNFEQNSDALAAFSPDNLNTVIAPDDALYMIYTSGSTGMPKAAMVSHKNEANLLAWYQQAYQFTNSDSFYVFSALGFDLTQKNIFMPLCLGATLVLDGQNQFDPAHVQATIAKKQATVINCAPSMFYSLLETSDNFAALQSLSFVLLGGEPIAMEKCISWLESEHCHAKLVNMYGPTECTDIATAFTIENPRQYLQKNVPVGNAINNVQLNVLDSGLKILPQGFTGELVISGESLGLGYFQREQLNQQAFIQHPLLGRCYKTGDLAFKDNNGNWQFVSRIDNQMKLRGLRIEAGEIIYAIKQQLGLADVELVLDNQQLWAFYLGKPEALTESWKAKLGEFLPNFMIPSQLQAISRWPLSANGKIDKKALLALSQHSKKTVVAPRNETEQRLLAIFEAVLGQSGISIDDNFFDIGGHSLLAAKAVTRIREQFQQELPLQEMFFNPSVAGIATLLQNTSNTTLPAIEINREAFNGHYPLSFAQQRLWLIEQIQGHSTMYHIPLMLELSGEINTQALSQAVEFCSQQHEALRTQINVAENGQPYQFVNDQHICHLQLHTSDNLQQQISALLNQARSLLLSPLFEAHLISEQGNSQHVLLLWQHHLISDGLSSQILLANIASAYQAFCQGQHPGLQAPAVQYIDYSIWQRSDAFAQTLEAKLSFWQQTLSNTPILQLPFDNSPSKNASTEGALLSFNISEQQQKGLQAIAQSQGSTMFTVLLTCFKLLLARYSQQEDICIGTPVANRPFSALENTIGYFINTLAIRSQFTFAQSFNELLAIVNKQQAKALSHQDLPFEFLLDALDIERDVSHSPIFQAFFNYQKIDSTQPETLDGLTIKAFEPEQLAAQHAKFELSLNVSDSEQGLQASFEYRKALFNKTTIARMVQHFSILIDSIIAGSDNACDQLALISPEEKDLQLNPNSGLNATAFNYPKVFALHTLFEQQANQSPNAIAVADETQALSFSELDKKANQLAQLLISQKVKPGDAVALYYTRCVDLSISLLAILKAGACYLPIDPELPNERITFMLEDASIKIVLGTKALQESFPGQAVGFIASDNPEVYANYPSYTPEVKLNPDGLFNIIYTSGSTGNPKGVMVGQQAIINRLQWMQKQYPINQNDTVLQKTPYSFDVSVWELFWPLITGAKLYYAKPEGHKDPNYLAELIKQQKISTMHFVPSMLQVFLDTQPQNLPLRQVFCSGEALQLAQQQAFHKLLPNTGLHNLYGPTEAAVDVSYFDCSPSDNYRSVPIGKPIDNIQLLVLDKHLQVQPIGIPGMLYIGGVGLAQGYLGREQLTQETFIQNPYSRELGSEKLYKTGDLVRLLDDGNIEYLGRDDFQVKIRGLRIELGDIESALLSLDAIDEAVVVAQKMDGEQTLVAYFTSPQTQDEHSLKLALSEKLASFMLPQYFVQLEALPLSANGKINRKALPLPDFNQTQKTIIAPSNALQTELLALWQQHIKRPAISVDDDFFAIGGHSLKAAALANAISQHFAADFSLRDIFTASNIIEQALLLEQRIDQGQSMPAIKVLENREVLPLSFSQQRLWFLAQLAPESPAYNIPAAFKLTGPLQLHALQKALNALLHRHEVLRYQFVKEQGEPVITINPDATLTLQQTLCADEQGLKNCVEKLSLETFDLTNAPLMRVHLLVKNNNEHVVLINMHHIISDGRSMQIIISDLATLYYQQVSQQENLLAPLTIQYGDYSAWQRNWLQGDVLEQQLSFWRSELKDAPMLLRVPLDNPRPEVQSFNGAVYQFEIERDLQQKLKQCAIDNNATLFMVCLSAYKLLLHKYSQQQDVCIGIPMQGRSVPGVENLVGFFINALIIRSQFNSNASLEQIIEQVKQKSLSAFAHEHVPIEMLLNELGIERSLAFTPIAQFAFNMQQLPEQDIEQSLQQGLSQLGLELTTLESEQHIAKFDMQFSLVESSHGLSVGIEYNTDLFLPETIETMAGFYQELLGLFANASETRIAEVQLGEHAHSEHETVLPFSPVTRDIYLSSLSRPQSLENSTGYALNAPFAINKALWRQALEDVAMQSDMLRARIGKSDKPYQDGAYFIISDKPNLDFHFIDLSQQALNQEAIDQRLSDLIVQPFAIDEDPLARFYMVKISDENYWLALAVHHILYDGFASSMHLQHCINRYQELVANSTNDYTINDNCQQAFSEQWQQFDVPETLDFWQDKLSQCQGFNKQGDNKNQQILLSQKIDDEHFAAIRKFCRKQAITPPIYFKALFALLVAQQTRADNNFVLIESNSGRNKDNKDTLACLFHNTPFFVEQESLTGSVKAFFKALKKQQKSARNFSQISSMALSKIMPEGEVGFAYNFLAIEHYYPFFDQQTTGHRYTPNAEGLVDFRVQVDSHDVYLWLAFNSNLFTEYQFLQRIESLSLQLLQGVEHLAELDYRLDHKKVPTAQQPISRPDFLVSQVLQQANILGQETAINASGKTLSYEQLAYAVQHYSQQLLHQGIGPGSTVAVALDKNIELIPMLLAVVQVGATYVPMDLSYPDDRLAFMLEDSQADMLVTLQSEAPRFSLGNALLVDALPELSETLALPSVDAQQIIYKLYTSGSTGTPKAAQVYRHSFELLLQSYQQQLQLTDSDNLLVISALGFDLTQKNLFVALLSGATVVLHESDVYDPREIATLIEEQSISLINCAPSAFYPLVEGGHSDKLTSLRIALFGGEPIALSRLAPWLESEHYHCTLVNMYGPTECTDIATSCVLSPKEALALLESNQPVPLGSPYPGVNIALCNEQLQQLPMGFVGELCIYGASVGAGYWQRDDLTEAHFVDADFAEGKLYKTGDLAQYRQDENGNWQLYYIGRKDFQVKLHGLRIELGDIEQALKDLPDVRDSYVLLENEQLLSFVLAKALPENWREQLAQTLPSYMLPAQCQTLDAWPLTANGKIDRKALLALKAKNTQAKALVAPRSDTEHALADLWQEVLGVGNIGIHENFFEAGGDSLAAVRLIARIELRFEIKLPVASLFSSQTIAALAHEVEQQTQGWSPIVPIQPEGNKTPIFAVHALGGMVLSYEPLARALGKEQPFYGVQAMGFEPEQEPFDNLKVMVEYYCEAILQTQSEGPYQLLGHSFGGLIAVEIARRLQEVGKEVRFVGLIDTHMPIQFQAIALDDAGILKVFADHNFGEVDMPLKTLRLMKPDTMMTAVVNKLNGLVTEDFLQRAVAIIRGFQRMMINYHVAPLDINVVLYKPSIEHKGPFARLKAKLFKKQSQSHGWHKISSQLTIEQGQGDHFSMLKPPNSEVLATLIQKNLRDNDKL